MNSELSNYKFIEEIGCGSFGKVYRAINIITQESCAIKVIQHNKNNSKAMEYQEREIKILKSLSHPNIVKLIEVKETTTAKFLVLEYCNGGNLYTYLKKHGTLSQYQAQDIICQLINAMTCLHDCSLIHRDIKLSNILISFDKPGPGKNAKLRIKLADFGFSRELSVGDAVVLPEESLEMSCVGTPLNMAPEISTKKYSFEADVWSLGTVAYELLCGKPCFNGNTNYELNRSIEMGTFKIPKSLNISNEGMDFIASCLVENYKERITWNQIIEHPFVLRKELAFGLNKKWLKEDENNFIFSTKREADNKEESEYICNGCNILFSYSDKKLNIIDKEDELTIENDYVLV